MTDKYILDSHKPVLCDNLIEWAEWYETAERHIGKTNITPDILISTVFLGSDYNYSGIGEPILFETMVFGGKYDQEQERYRTWEEAEKGHERWVNKIKNEIQTKEKA